LLITEKEIACLATESAKGFTKHQKFDLVQQLNAISNHVLNMHSW